MPHKALDLLHRVFECLAVFRLENSLCGLPIGFHTVLIRNSFLEVPCRGLIGLSARVGG